MARAFERLSYGVSQSARVAWFFGHYLAALRAQGKESEADACRARCAWTR